MRNIIYDYGGKNMMLEREYWKESSTNFKLYFLSTFYCKVILCEDMFDILLQVDQ